MDLKEIRNFLDELLPSLGAVERLNLSSWLQDHAAAAPVSSNVPSQNLPFQRWYRFKEAFSPLLVVESLRSLDFWPQTCLDCFGGSGTTALTSQFLGISPITVEVNPFLADLIEAKLSKYESSSLINDYCTALNSALARKVELKEGMDWPATLVEPGVKGRWIYKKDTFAAIIALRDSINEIDSLVNRRLLKVLLGSILVETSNVYISGKGRRYRQNWQASQKSPVDVFKCFQQAVNEAISDITAHGTRRCSTYDLLRGDARKANYGEKQIDVALFSPPYPNSFDYTDIYNLELWVLGYLQSREDNFLLRRSTLRSHVQVSRDLSWESMQSPKLTDTVNKLTAVRDSLWDRNLPDMIGAYFADLGQVLSSIRNNINPKGAVMMTVGDSHYANVLVDVGEILREMAPSFGFVCESITQIRSMRTSVQQGWSSTLSEEMVTLRPI